MRAREFIKQGMAEGKEAEGYKEKLISTIPQILRFLGKNSKGWTPTKDQMLQAVEAGYVVMKQTGDVKQAGKAVMDELNTLYRINQGHQDVSESIAPPLPEVLYHGGPKPITKFNIPPYGVYFSPHLTHAQGYGDVVTSARVNANNVYLIDYENDIDEDIMDALFDMDYRRVAKYIKLLQKQGYDAMQSISDSEMVVVFPGTPIQVIDNKQDAVEGLSWSSLDEGLSTEDKMFIFEEFHTKGNLTESLDEDKRKYFESLISMSDKPFRNEKYIVVPLSLVGNRILPLDKPSFMKFLGRTSDGQLVFRKENSTIKYPSATMRNISVFNTFTFSTQEAYDKFRTALSLKFDDVLSTVKKQGAAEGTIDEMTQRTGKLNNKMSQNFVDKNKKLWYKSPIIGQIEEYDLRKYNEMYSLWNNSDYVASAMLKDINDSGISDIGLFHVAVEYRGQKILSKLIWNFKTRQNRSILRIDPYHSDDLYDIIYGSGLSRFKKYWMDNNGNIEPYDKSTVNKYYSYLGKTNWQLILENNYNYSDMPHFSEGKNWITEDYSWQII